MTVTFTVTNMILATESSKGLITFDTPQHMQPNQLIGSITTTLHDCVLVISSTPILKSILSTLGE